MRARERLLKRAAKIEANLAVVQTSGAVVRKHCTATDAEIQSAIRKHKEEREKAEIALLGAESWQKRCGAIYAGSRYRSPRAHGAAPFSVSENLACGYHSSHRRTRYAACPQELDQ